MAKAEQAVTLKELQRQKLVRNGLAEAFLLYCIFALIFLAQRNKIKEEKSVATELLLNILPARGS
jgi:hypothetical protein